MSTRDAGQNQNAARRSGTDPFEELMALLELMRPPRRKDKPPKTLTAAVFQNDLELAKKFLAAGHDVNERPRMGSPLGYAVVRGNLEMINLFVGAGAQNPGSNLPTAAERGDLPVMRRLFELGVDLEKDGGPALAIAAYRNQVEAVKFLLEKGVPPAINNFHAVSEAARNASIEALQVFFAAGVKPENCGAALRRAAYCPLTFKSVKFLVEAGVDPRNHPAYWIDFNYPDKKLDKPFTPADAAAEQKKTEVADYLNGKPIDVEALLAKEEERRKSWDMPGTDEAIQEEHERKTAHLLRGQARVEAAQRAVELVRNSALKPRLDEQGKSGHTALCLACTHGDLDIVVALLEAGASPNQADKWKSLPLIEAAENCHSEIVEKLLQSGADPNAKDGNQTTALIEAADWGEPKLVKLLLDAGADPNAKDQGGRTPMKVQHGLHGPEIKAMLQEASKKKSGPKPPKSSGLKFVKRKKTVDIATARGVQDFRKFYYSNQPEWCLVAVQAPVGDAADAYAKMVTPTRWEKDVAAKHVRPGKEFVYVLQLKGGDWTIILLQLGWLDEEGWKQAEKVAGTLSKTLKTRAYTYLAEDTSGAEAYEMFESGTSQEKAEHSEGISFESKIREQPKFDEKLFPDPVFAEDGIYLPACYPEDDGYATRLVLEGLKAEDVARVDYFALKD